MENDEGFKTLGMGLLAFARIVMVFVQAPIWGAQHFKDPIRIGMALGMTALAFPYLPRPEVFPTEAKGFMLALLTQLGVGAVIGWVSFLVMATAQFGGEMLDIQMGLSAAAQADPASHGAVNLMRRLQFYIAMLLYLIMDGHHQLWVAVFRSFEVVPLTHFQMTHMQLDKFLDLSGNIYNLGLQIASPVVGALFVAQVALGMVARAAPQMNVFMISFPMNLGIGLILLTVSLDWILKVYASRFGVNFDQINEAVQMIAPHK